MQCVKNGKPGGQSDCEGRKDDVERDSDVRGADAALDHAPFAIDEFNLGET
jgi:hypothetical protein